MAENNDNYVVLARKYRPQNFSELLGQDALVQTITNAIKNNRLHHAYILTGIRGVGKTTTARIIAKALNCTGKDSNGGPTVNPCGICDNCRAIAESRHIDVLELDAASRTGVDDIREILDGVRYKPTSARYKVYIIDEVHMLSKQAFNALLKTLEEPPAHVIFIFATTEIRKVPVTVLSRCQRFDLQRLSIDTLVGHFKNIVTKENLKAEDEALHLIARAADGSCRDGLSLLDQAIALGGGEVKTEIVKNMIGVAERGATFAIFEALIGGKMDELMALLDKQRQDGAAPLTLLQDLINITHLVAKVKIVPEFIGDASLSENEKDFCSRLSPLIPMAVLSKIWQMMIKGLGELNIAPIQQDALEMILLRTAYSANLPTPEEILNGLKKNSELDNQPEVAQSSQANDILQADSDAMVFNTPEELVDYLTGSKKMLVAYSLSNDVSFIEFRQGYIKMAVSEKINSEFLLELQNILAEATATKWIVDIASGALGETLAQKKERLAWETQKDALDLPLVKAIMAEFANAKIETMTRKINNDNQTDEETSLTQDYNQYIEDEN